jgi:hypothetical protein
MQGEITVTEMTPGVLTVDFGDGTQQDYPTMADAMHAADIAAQQDGRIVRVVTTLIGPHGEARRISTRRPRTPTGEAADPNASGRNRPT